MFSAQASNLYFRLVQGLQSRKSCVLRVSGCLDIPNQGRKGMFCACHRPREPTAVKIVTLLCNQIRQFCNLIRSVSSVLTIKYHCFLIFTMSSKTLFTFIVQGEALLYGGSGSFIEVDFLSPPPISTFPRESVCSQCQANS